MNEELMELYNAEATKYELGPSKEELYPLAGGVTTIETTFEEEAELFKFYSGKKKNFITDINYNFAIKGYRDYADKTQAYIRDKLVKTNERDCYLKVTEPDGRILEGNAEAKNIKPIGGDAGTPQTFEFEVAFTEEPTDTPKAAGKAAAVKSDTKGQ